MRWGIKVSVRQMRIASDGIFCGFFFRGYLDFIAEQGYNESDFYDMRMDDFEEEHAPTFWGE